MAARFMLPEPKDSIVISYLVFHIHIIADRHFFTSCFLLMSLPVLVHFQCFTIPQKSLPNLCLHGDVREIFRL